MGQSGRPARHVSAAHLLRCLAGEILLAAPCVRQLAVPVLVRPLALLQLAPDLRVIGRNLFVCGGHVRQRCLRLRL
eukprot:5375125-Pyramimonas_sp.AAC.1